MIVVIIIGVLLAIAMPAFQAARAKSRAQAIVADLREIEGAKERYLMENQLTTGDPVGDASALAPVFIKEWPQGPVQGNYAANAVGSAPTFNGQTGDWYIKHCTGATADSACPL